MNGRDELRSLMIISFCRRVLSEQMTYILAGLLSMLLRLLRCKLKGMTPKTSDVA